MRRLAFAACLTAAGAAFALAFAAGAGQAAGLTDTYAWRLPPGFPVPKVPADNPMTEAKVQLGRRLFYDTRLSGNNTQSCASCHEQARAFADRLPRGVGSTGETHPRGSMSLANVAYSPALTWANPNMRRLEAQALVPMFGEHPVELGLAGKEGELLARLAADARYRAWFAAAFPSDTASGASPVTVANVAKAVASFERTLLSGTSPYDRAKAGGRRGLSGGLSALAREGERLFFSEKTECFHCHGSFNFTNSVDYQGKGFAEVEFHNTGLYNVGGTGAYPKDNPGIREFTGDPEDEGKFKAPSLRNVALTAPYMHDGSIPTLEAVVDHYAAGGRTVRSGPNAGVGRENPRKSEFVKGFRATPRERAALVAFLRSLTDSAFITDARHANPWADTLPAPHALPPAPASARPRVP